MHQVLTFPLKGLILINFIISILYKITSFYYIVIKLYFLLHIKIYVVLLTGNKITYLIERYNFIYVHMYVKFTFIFIIYTRESSRNKINLAFFVFVCLWLVIYLGSNE